MFPVEFKVCSYHRFLYIYVVASVSQKVVWGKKEHTWLSYNLSSLIKIQQKVVANSITTMQRYVEGGAAGGGGYTLHRL